MSQQRSEIHERAYRDPADLDATLRLLEAVRAADPDEDPMTAERWQVELREPGFDPAQDLRVWEDADGHIIGIAALFLPSTGADQSYLWWRIHPDRPAPLLMPPILDWAAQRAASVARERGQALAMRAAVRDRYTEQMALLERAGFRAVRTFYRMACPLERSLPEPAMPAGFRLAHTAGHADAERWAELFNQSFIDHYNHRPMTVAESHHAMEDPGYAPEHDLIAIAPDGTWAGFCRCLIDHAENRLTGHQQGWIRVLGTRRGFRRIGLGRALLLAGLHTLRDAGMTTAVLGVDAENPSGAVSLYQSVGFNVISRTIQFLRQE